MILKSTVVASIVPFGTVRACMLGVESIKSWALNHNLLGHAENKMFLEPTIGIQVKFQIHTQTPIHIIGTVCS